jgi:hypothetical protein
METNEKTTFKTIEEFSSKAGSIASKFFPIQEVHQRILVNVSKWNLEREANYEICFYLPDYKDTGNTISVSSHNFRTSLILFEDKLLKHFGNEEKLRL